MFAPQPARQYRFGVFEADSATGELRRQGIRVKLNAQPFQVLCLLLDRAGELLTRDEIARELWPDGTFVDFEHGVNSAVNRIREALGDTAGNPRFVETLARRGYRFVAPVAVSGLPEPPAPKPEPTPEAVPVPAAGNWLSAPHELPSTQPRTVQILFLLLQGMYLAFYIGALANLAEIEELMAPLPHPEAVFLVLVATASILIPVRVFLLCAVLFHPPGIREKILKLWNFLLPADVLWSLSPFLLLHHISFGLALACTAILVYSPFAQRSLVLMGAAEELPAPGEDRKRIPTG